ncbi:MAG: DUF418 domain-containing protein [Alphaproteobacteria bacterium]|nr:DUF418 domain-containing protein [Alphaproteobacteria bacterium]MBV9370908.1 DUF418 domain-containing protein [Alphaproteobacteria bacterium]MBV9900687.1 DUF418 domain-containing protein [Alphaproteobacteria bacterium]
MTAATAPRSPLPESRIATLDILRGVGVMGILAMNIVAFAMPDAAYVNPRAYGSRGGWDYASWAFSFVFIDGKMRGLFSFLFGASLLLVIDKARAKGESPARIHFRRMLWLLLFGYLHFFLIWYGDILTGYASVGMIAWFYRNKPAHRLVAAGIVCIAVELALMTGLAVSVHALSAAVAAGHADADTLESLRSFSETVAVPTPAELAAETGRILGGWGALVRSQLADHGFDPLIMLAVFGPETLGYMLLGMAALKSGFFTGAWEDSAYRRVAAAGFAITVPAYALLAWLIWRSGFSVPALYAWSYAATVPLRPAMVAAIAALVILATRRGGPLVARIGAAGRAAFTNYLGTSLLMTGLFYGWGLGLFGRFGRIELWLVVLAMWALMLAWSKPWLERFRYGPFEWLWRSLARGSPQPMRRRK